MFETLGVQCATGAKAKGRYLLGELRDGSQVTLPVRIVHGAHDGPTVSFTGAIHGDEPYGMATINRVFDAVDPAQLSGILIGFPMANPFAAITTSRISGVDYERLNLNRVFPGNADGLITERVAAAIFEGGIRQANYHLDYHEGGYDFVAKYLITRENSKEGLRLARAFGMGIPINVTRHTPQALRLGRGGASTEQSEAIGVSGLTSELGGAGHIWPEFVEIGFHGTMNVLKEVGALPGEKVTVAQEQLVGVESMWPRPQHGGWWEQVVEPGQVVEANQTVGYVKDAFGEVIEELKAPYRAVIFDIRNTTLIMTGEWTVHCGRLAD